MDSDHARELVGRAEARLERVEALPDPEAREAATEAVAALVDLYGEGLARVVGEVAERDDGSLAAAFAEDELVSHLLLLHDLHPVPVAERVAQALEEVRPYLESHGGNVELVSVGDGVVRLQLEGSCSGCPSSAMTLKLAIENAIHKHAPEVEGVEAEGAAEAPGPQLIQLEVAPGGGAAPAPGNGDWTTAGGIPELSGNGSSRPLLREVSGEPVLFVKLEANLYAYRPSCPSCASSLADATLAGVDLTCSGCGLRFDVIRAGRCLDAPQLHLDPIPLLIDDDGLVKLALGAAA